MQGRVARRIGPVLNVSQSSADDIYRDFRVPRGNVRVIPLAVDTRLFHPRPPGRVPGPPAPARVIGTLLRAYGNSTKDRDAVLSAIGTRAPGGPTERLVCELALGDR